MILRRQLPVHSPLTLRALLSGLRSAVSASDRSRERVRGELARRYDARHALLTDSGTTALALALTMAARRRDGPAALPAYGCYDLATAADAADVEVVLYDLKPETLAPDPASVRSVLTERPSALVVAPLYGVPVEMDFLRSAAREAGALLVEDAAQSFEAYWQGEPVGSHGDVAVVSFGRGKGVTGGGGGGLLALRPDSDRLFRAAGRQCARGRRGWRPLAQAAAQWALGRPWLFTLPASLPFLDVGETVYREPHSPAGIPAACAGVLAHSFELERSEAEKRRAHAERLRQAAVKASDIDTVTVPGDGRAGWLRFPVLARPEESQARLSSERARRLGIMPGYPKSLVQLDSFRHRIRNIGDGFSGTMDLVSSLFTLPSHSLMTESDFRQVEQALID